MEYQECPEKLRLLEQYSRAITDFSHRLEAWRRSPRDGREANRRSIENAREESEGAWLTLERHMLDHRCVGAVAERPPALPIPPDASVTTDPAAGTP